MAAPTGSAILRLRIEGVDRALPGDYNPVKFAKFADGVQSRPSARHVRFVLLAPPPAVGPKVRNRLPAVTVHSTCNADEHPRPLVRSEHTARLQCLLDETSTSASIPALAAYRLGRSGF